MLRRETKLPISKDFLISIVAGSEAGIATTAAIIVGLSIGTDDRQVVTVSALIAIVIQAFNSAVSTVLTAHTLDEIEHNRDMNSLIKPLTQGGVQFLMHMLMGLLVLLPMVYVTELEIAMVSSVGVALVLLIWIGLFIGFLVRHTPLRNSIQSFVLGMLIIIGGFLAGYVIN